MKILLVGLIVAALSSDIMAQPSEIPNRLINYDAFLSQASTVKNLRRSRRITEEEFIRMMKEPDTVIFDARSKDKYQKLHILGAKHLSFPDITKEELENIIPSKSSRILIYCNNNFLNASDAFPTKAPAASLNIHTYNVLFSYGYNNIFELGPLLDIRNTKIPFAGLQLLAPNQKQ